MNKFVSATEFKAKCLKLIDEINNSGNTLTVTKRGKPVAELRPVASEDNKSLFGAMKGSVLKYDEPFEPAIGASEWDAMKSQTDAG